MTSFVHEGVTYSSGGYLILDNGTPTEVHHNAGCRCLREHGPYRESDTSEGLRPCGYCGGGGVDS